MSRTVSEPAWLEDFQSEFAKSIRTPFDFSSGKSIRKQTELFSSKSYEHINPFKKLSPKDRLAVYNEQYWFRYLTLMQGDYPLLSRYMGLWEFNKLVTQYLTKNPSKSILLQLLGAGFPKFLSEFNIEDPVLREQYIEMATLDRLWSDVFLSRGAISWVPTEVELQSLESNCLEFHPSFKLYKESWNCVNLRKKALALEGEEALSEQPIKNEMIWVFFRGDRGVVSMPLEPALARLLDLLQEELLHISLEKVANEFPDENLNSKVMQWFQQGLQLGWFTGVKK